CDIRRQLQKLPGAGSERPAGARQIVSRRSPYGGCETTPTAAQSCARVHARAREIIIEFRLRFRSSTQAPRSRQMREKRCALPAAILGGTSRDGNGIVPLSWSHA